MRQQKDKTLELLLAVINVFNQQQKLLGVNYKVNNINKVNKSLYNTYPNWNKLHYQLKR